MLFRALVARREAVHNLLVSTSRLSTELTALVRQSRGRPQAGARPPENVVGVLNKNEDNIDNSLRLMAPFYRVFANTLGNGPWFDTYIQNLPPAPDRWVADMTHAEAGRRPRSCSCCCWSRRRSRCSAAATTKTLTAHFPRTISIYEGSDVRVLGVPVGTVDTVTPVGHRRGRDDAYDADVKVPADAKAVIVAPSIVGDRFVQLTPVYDGGAVLADGADARRRTTPRSRSSSTRSTPASTT